MPHHNKSADRLQTPRDRTVAPAQKAREPLEQDSQNVPDPRTKSSGHRKKTADKWNQ
jgi:hypothetical protein